jgi:transcriptional regulator with GAF, ATPase, and Fis domain
VVHSMGDPIEPHIRKALKASGGKGHGKNGAAERLGINPGTLRHKMRKLGIFYDYILPGL